MPTFAWYDVSSSTDPIAQGDILIDCPVLIWADEECTEPENPEVLLRDKVHGDLQDVVVMTQQCDLEHGKVAEVILCPHITLEEHRGSWELVMQDSDQKITPKAWERELDSIKGGSRPNMSMLNKSTISGLTMGHRIVYFHTVYSLPRTFLESWLRLRKANRLKLLPPYREHLSQAFARYFMRVGLPEEVDNYPSPAVMTAIAATAGTTPKKQ